MLTSLKLLLGTVYCRDTVIHRALNDLTTRIDKLGPKDKSQTTTGTAPVTGTQVSEDLEGLERQLLDTLNTRGAELNYVKGTKEAFEKTTKTLDTIQAALETGKPRVNSAAFKQLLADFKTQAAALSQLLEKAKPK